MPWKKDDKNNLVVDENGNPVWTTEAGEDKPVDYAALSKRLSEVNAESKGRKEELRKSAERYARLKDIEDVSAWYVHLALCGIDTPPIPVTDATSRMQCAKAMLPDLFGLEPLPENEMPRSLDVAFMGGRRFLLHCGLAVETCEGLKILHCPETSCGVCLDSPNECRLMGFSSIKWFRHKEIDAALRQRGLICD